MKRHPKLTWKTFNYFGVLAVVASIAVIVIVCLVLQGCVKVRKQTTIFITNPVTLVDMQNGDSDKDGE